MKSWKKFFMAAGLLTAIVRLNPVWASPPASSQTKNRVASALGKQDTALTNAAARGVPLQVTTTVSDSASIQAVLIPANVAKTIFGKEVSQNYAVVEVIVSNHDPNAALLVHSVFIDTSHWLLSGEATCSQGPPEGLTINQTANSACQVASIESRLVRGELLDRQQWTARNWTMRTLTAMGSVAAAFQFPFSADYAKGVAAFSGTVVPGAATFWPDGMVGQINQISDFGFRTDKIIPANGADVVVAFFPIERFLTPSFRRLFLQNPAGLFVPNELYADPKTRGLVEQFLKPLVDQVKGEGNYDNKMLQSMAAECSGVTAAAPNDESSECKVRRMINGLSLNNVRVVIEGAMTVDTGTVPATIYGVDFGDGNTGSIWSTPGNGKKGSISGVYLGNGVPAVVDRNGKAVGGITIQAVADGSTDTQLNFTMDVAKCIPSSTQLFLVVNKKQTSTTGNAKAVPVSSTPYEFPNQPDTGCVSNPNPNGGAGTQPDGGAKQAPKPDPAPPAAPVNEPPKGTHPITK